MDRYATFVVIGLLAVGAAACSAPRPVRSVKNPNPSGKIPAIKEAAREKDERVVAQLVEDLDSDDPAVRFYAITGLRRITGEEFGYRYYDDEIDRQPAIKRWQGWLAEQERDDNGSGQQEARPDESGATDAPDHASEP